MEAWKNERDGSSGEVTLLGIVGEREGGLRNERERRVVVKRGIDRNDDDRRQNE